MTELLLINSSTYALSILLLPLPSSFNSTAKTSIGGESPNLFARTQRFILAIPIAGYNTVPSQLPTLNQVSIAPLCHVPVIENERN